MNMLAMKLDDIVTPEYVKARLEMAGYALQCLPGEGPREYGCNWPDIPRASVETWILQLQAEQDVEVKRALAEDANRIRQHATKEQIAAIDDAEDWVLGLDNIPQRRIVLMRMFKHPLSERYKFSWSYISRKMAMSRTRVRELHDSALGKIARAC